LSGGAALAQAAPPAQTSPTYNAPYSNPSDTGSLAQQ